MLLISFIKYAYEYLRLIGCGKREKVRDTHITLCLILWKIIYVSNY